MGQATFANNTTIKINGGAAATTNSVSTVTITAAANEYIIGTITPSVTLGIAYNSSLSVVSIPANTMSTFYISSGSYITLNTGTVAQWYTYSYVRFLNSP